MNVVMQKSVLSRRYNMTIQRLWNKSAETMVMRRFVTRLSGGRWTGYLFPEGSKSAYTGIEPRLDNPSSKLVATTLLTG